MFRLPQSELFSYDALMRLPIVLFTTSFLVYELTAFSGFIERYPAQMEIHFITALSVHISLVLFLLLQVVLHLIRAKPVNKAQGWQPKTFALLGLTSLYLLLPLDHAVPSYWFNLASGLFLLLGYFLCIVVLLHLGRSLSIMAEARRLVTSGPYSIIRHPLYFVEEFIVFGIFLQYRSWEAAAIACLHFMFQIQRMFNEERILCKTFSEYPIYMQKTARLIPGVW